MLRQFTVIDQDQLEHAGSVLLHKSLSLTALALMGLILVKVFRKLVDRLIDKAEDGVLPDRLGRITMGRNGNGAPAHEAGSTRRMQRAKTVGSLLKSIVTGVVVTVVFTMMLSQLGVNIAPIIASAGIIGIALGFGAQTLVKDFLSGLFMLFEDQYGVGDAVDLGEASGTVEAVSLRVTRLRDVNGTVWYVRNGEILRVGNSSQNWGRSVIDVPVAYQEDLARVRRVLQEVAHDLWEDDDFKGRIIEEPEVWGVESVSPDGVIVRVTLKTAPMEQWAVGREMRARIKARFDHEGISAPYRQSVVWNRSSAGAPATATAGSGDPDADAGS